MKVVEPSIFQGKQNMFFSWFEKNLQKNFKNKFSTDGWKTRFVLCNTMKTDSLDAY